MTSLVTAARAHARGSDRTSQTAGLRPGSVVRAVPTATDRPWVYGFTKRAFDVAFAGIALIFTLPVIGVLSIIVRLDSPGPAIFRQLRVGQNGRAFTFYKFRTMYVDARERFPELYAYTYTGEEWQDLFYKLPDDPRLTRFGRWLRKTTLDELPNLFNVLLGQMSLVGPRPELPEYTMYYSPEQLVKFSVRSGVTGLAQVSGRGMLPVQDQISADVEYVQRRSWAFDMAIVLRTVRMVVLRVGAF